MARAYVIVEGHGEQEAALNLLSRLSSELGLAHLVWARPIRGKALGQRDSLRRYCEFVRRKPDAGALLVMRDEDDGCPREIGPEHARWLADLTLPFPAALVLAHREYESLFLASLTTIAGEPLGTPGGLPRAGLREDSVFDGDPEQVRGAKEWLSRRMTQGRRYKPTLDQLPMTRMVDFDRVRRAKLPWFGTLERALRFLDENVGVSGTYPPSTNDAR